MGNIIRVLVTRHAENRIKERIRFQSATEIEALVKLALKQGALIFKEFDNRVFRDFDGYTYYFNTDQENKEYDLVLTTVNSQNNLGMFSGLKGKMLSNGTPEVVRDSPYEHHKIKVELASLIHTTCASCGRTGHGVVCSSCFEQDKKDQIRAEEQDVHEDIDGVNKWEEHP